MRSIYSFGMLARFRFSVFIAFATLGSACATVQRGEHSSIAPGDYAQATPVVKTTSQKEISFASIEHFLTAKGTNLRTPRPGVWHVSVDGIIIMTIADHDRLRILAPIFALEQLDSEPGVQHALLRRLLQANFDQAADARYAIFDGIVFATITSARTTVHEADLDRFITQVVNLHKNTFRSGPTGYSSDAPDPDSVEVDPRKDSSLEVPDAYDHRPTPVVQPMIKRESLSL